MENNHGYVVDSVAAGRLVQINTKNQNGEEMALVPVIVTPSLSDFQTRSEMPAGVLLASLRRCLESYKFTGAKPPEKLKVYVSARDNMYFESITLPWDNTGKPCIVFAMPGQINEDNKSIAELSAEARAHFAGMTPAEHEAIRKEALKRAYELLDDPEASPEAKRASRELLSIEETRKRKEQEDR
jgi:hypothetical protein